LSIAYTVAAVLAFMTFRRWFGTIGTPELWAPLWRVVIASIPMGVVVLVVSNLSGSTSLPGLLGRVVAGSVCGLVTFAAVVVWLGRRDERRHKSEPGPEPPKLVARSRD
jgi:peptidoglycan biosynthesis protein MviN/MurJ (putative lipid II flippase)